jgi:hypothetical protein
MKRDYRHSKTGRPPAKVIASTHRPFLPSGAGMVWSHYAARTAKKAPLKPRPNASLARWAKRKSKVAPPSLPKLPWESSGEP